MSLKLNQFMYTEGGTNGLVHPEEDALLYHHVLKANHMITSLSATSLGANKLLISSGSGIVYGRMFIVGEETLSVPLSSEGEQPGRTIIRINIGDVDAPITWEHQMEDILPPLRQDNFLDGGTVFEIPVASYLITDRELLDVNNIPFTSENLMYKEKFDTSGNVESAGGILAAIYPVGSIYMSLINQNPGTLFNFGVWERIANGRVLMGIDEEDTDFSAPEQIGGHKLLQSHTHTGPSHTHTGPSHTHTGPSHTHSIAARTSGSAGTHAHSINPSMWLSGSEAAGYGLNISAGFQNRVIINTSANSAAAQNAGAHTHSIPAATTGASGTGATGASGTGNTGANGTGDTGFAGDGDAQNLPPYMTCYMWTRIS